MFSFSGETVLDPFLGSGTTAKVALELNRNAIGYEINGGFLKIIKEKLGLGQLNFAHDIQIIKRDRITRIIPQNVRYIPRIKDAKPRIDPKMFRFKDERLYRVVEIIDESKIKLDTGLIVKFISVKVNKKEEAIKYLMDYLLGKEVFLKFENNTCGENNVIEAYVYLKNRIPDLSKNYRLKDKFVELWRKREKSGENGEGMDT